MPCTMLSAWAGALFLLAHAFTTSLPGAREQGHMHQLATVLTSTGEDRREDGSYGRVRSPEISEKRKGHQHKTKPSLIWLACQLTHHTLVVMPRFATKIALFSAFGTVNPWSCVQQMQHRCFES